MSEREPEGGDAEFFSMMRALQALKSGPLGDYPSNRALGKAAGVTATTIGDWLRGKRLRCLARVVHAVPTTRD